MQNENGVSRVQRRGREAVVAVWGEWAVANFSMNGPDNLILGWAHIFDEMTKNENRKMNPPFFLFQKSKTKTSGKQAEQKSSPPVQQNPLTHFPHLSAKFFLLQKSWWIFLFFLFGIFFLFPRTAVSRVQRRKGAKQIFCDGNFLEIMVYWEHGKGERVWDY